MPKRGYRWSEERKREWMETEAYKNFCESHKLKPSEESKLKMSEAKLGVKKSPEHRKAMSEAQKKRQAKFRAVKAENPHLSFKEIWALVKAMG